MDGIIIIINQRTEPLVRPKPHSGACVRDFCARWFSEPHNVNTVNVHRRLHRLACGFIRSQRNGRTTFIELPLETALWARVRRKWFNHTCSCGCRRDLAKCCENLCRANGIWSCSWICAGFGRRCCRHNSIINVSYSSCIKNWTERPLCLLHICLIICV